MSADTPMAGARIPSAAEIAAADGAALRAAQLRQVHAAALGAPGPLESMLAAISAEMTAEALARRQG